MIQLLYIDLFCGAGGTSTGVNEARLDGEQCAKVIACVNHDAKAIASHAANHPEALHFTEDIRTLDLAPLLHHVQKYRYANPQASVVLWASLECTNFSRAKGGLPRDADSRTLAEHLYRYIEAIDPDFIQIENVEEFMSWGPLDDKGLPVSKDKGRDYVRWVRNVSAYGYDYDYRILNAADYGARTTRKRFFGMFAKKGLPIVFPTPTHSRRPVAGLRQWRPVRHVINLEEYGQSIFARKKPLVESTLRRICAGLVKFVAGGKDAFLIKYNSMNQRGRYVPPSIDDPCPTVAVQGRLGLARVEFLSKQYSGGDYDKNISIDGPAGAITCIDHHALVSAHFMTSYYGNGHCHDIDSPFPTVTTKDKFALVYPQFIDMQYGQGRPTSTIKAGDSPMTVKIKEFMALYNIADIKMRMLQIVELKRIQGFPDNYVLMGNQSDQKKFIGNAVHTSIPKAWCPALCRALRDLDAKTNTNEIV